MTDRLEAFRARAEREPFFLASLLAAFARAEDLDDAGVAAALGCKVEDMLMIRLCRAPRADARGYRDDIDSISGRFGLDPARLAEVVKRGRVLTRLLAAGEGADQPGWLMAARDREGGPPEPPS